MHALRVLRNVRTAERKKSLVRSDPRHIAAMRELAPPVATPLETLEDAERQARHKRLVAVARGRLSNPLDRELLQLSCDDIDKPAEQAARVGRPIEDIRRANERIRYALRAAIDDEED